MRAHILIISTLVFYFPSPPSSTRDRTVFEIVGGLFLNIIDFNMTMKTGGQIMSRIQDVFVTLPQVSASNTS